MRVSRIVRSFVAGVLLINSVPHGVSALQGRTFPSPFGKPPGQGHSSPESNAVWSAANASLGALALPRGVRTPAERAGFALGSIGMGFFLASRFRRVHDLPEV